MPLTLQQLREKRPEIERVAARHRVRNIGVFGSVARGSAEPWSDVDFLVDLLPGHSLLDRAGLIAELTDLLGVGVDVVARTELRDDVRDRIVREAVAL